MKQSSTILRRLSAGALSAALLCGGVVAGATVATKTMNAQYNDVKITLNGLEVTPTDADGKVVEPFIVDGTTYLPVRAIANAMGLPVEWDGATKTVCLGEDPSKGTNWMTKLPPYQLYKATLYDGSDRKASFSVAGVTQTLGVVIKEDWGQGYAIWNTNCQYNTMTITIGSLSSATWDGTLEVYLDGEYSTEYELKYDAAPKTINIPLNYSPNVKLLITRGQYGLYDISFS